MNYQKNNSESHFLILSALFTSGFAIGGLILGWLASSLVIMFDGIYSLMGLLLTLLSLTVSHYIHHPKKSVSPMNKVILEQLMIAIKAVVIFLSCRLFIIRSDYCGHSRGRTVDTSVATLFGLINVIGCFYAWRTLADKNLPSSFGLIDAEIKQWKMDTYLSVSVTLGFIIAFGMRFTPGKPTVFMLTLV
ncbi:cation transporter [Vibrio sp. PP-XX7]